MFPAMDQATQDDQAYNVDLDAMAAEHVSHLGPDPSFHQFATYMTKLQLKSHIDLKRNIASLHTLMSTTTINVHTNTPRTSPS